MIEYIEVRDGNFETIGIIDTAKSIIWHKKYFSVGDFEIYAQATSKSVNLLQRGNWVTRLNDDEIGIIERIEITQNAQDGMTIIASGRFAKSILDRRIIYTLSGKMNKATVLRGNVESAARALIVNNAISCSFNANRNFPNLALGGHSGSTHIIRDGSGRATQKQVTNDNLLTYSDALLQEYGMSAKIVLSSNETGLEYKCFEGIDRSMNNASGIESIIFSSDFDNLAESDYQSDETTIRNMALIGGEGEGLNRFYSAVEGDQTGMERREIFIDGGDIQKQFEGNIVRFFVDNNDLYAVFAEEDQEQNFLTTAIDPLTGILSVTYPDDTDTTLAYNNGNLSVTTENEQSVEQEYTDAEYKEMLDSRGKLKLAQMIQVDSFSGTIDTAFGSWLLNRDYSLGDIVTIQNNEIGIYANVRITETTEVQDENGYAVSLNFE